MGKEFADIEVPVKRILLVVAAVFSLSVNAISQADPAQLRMIRKIYVDRMDSDIDKDIRSAITARGPKFIPIGGYSDQSG
jgi:hypothetical protein